MRAYKDPIECGVNWNILIRGLPYLKVYLFSYKKYSEIILSVNFEN